MPQNGFHGLAGLAAARWVAPRVPAAAAEIVAASVVLGAMLPDVDVYPAAVATLLGRDDLTYDIHRTFTHSLLAVLLVLGAGAVLRRRSPAAAWACGGLALGMLTHLFLDAFFWFAPLDLFWPFSRLPADTPLLPVIDLWSSVRPLPALFGKPDLLVNLREAWEPGAFALYLLALRRVTQRDEPRAPKAQRLARWERWGWAGFAVALAGAVTLPHTAVEFFVYALWLLALAPFCWSQTVRLRREIARWSLSANSGSLPGERPAKRATSNPVGED
jgi:membrane-bound metal-dependent hydrolase YbcI (DUF457 family)